MTQSYSAILFMLGLATAAFLIGIQDKKTSNYTAPPQSTATTLAQRVNVPLENIVAMATQVKDKLGKDYGCVHPFETSYVTQSGENYGARFMFLAHPENGMPYGVEADGTFDKSFQLTNVTVQTNNALQDYEYLPKDGYQNAALFEENAMPTRAQLTAAQNLAKQ